MNYAHTALVLSIIFSAGFASSASACPHNNADQDHCIVDQCGVQKKVEVVFVLDTTGSMSGLIDGAKQKIWSIASTIAQAQPAPEIRMGLVGYRDRGDAYITTKTSMTDDLDTVYEKLMGFNAAGGGDTPESVNEALFEAVERFDWSDDPNTLKIIFLVGDAPPQMGYNNDVKYQASCKIAGERGIIINTIQCGNLSGTQKHWSTISNLTNGQYAAIDQDSGVQRITTRYDDEIRELDLELASLMIDYGTSEERSYQITKRSRASKIASGSSLEAYADRAVYNQTAAGKTNLLGKKELVDDVASGRVSFDEMDSSLLPESLQSKSMDELKDMVETNNARRIEIQKRLSELAALRSKEQEIARKDIPSDAFDLQVLMTLEKQGETIGLKINTPKEDD